MSLKVYVVDNAGCLFLLKKLILISDRNIGHTLSLGQELVVSCGEMCAS